MSEERKKDFENFIKDVNGLSEEKQKYAIGYLAGMMDCEKMAEEKKEKN